MHPILFELPGGLPIRSFGLLVAAGFLLGSWIFSRLVARFSADPKRDVALYGAIPVWVLIGIVLGARLMYVIVEIARGSPSGETYLRNPWTILAIWQGGLVMYGGMFGGLVGGAWCARRHKLPLWHAMDLGMISAFFGLMVGRIGCLMVGDDYGRRVPEAYVDLPFPITLRVPEVLPAHSLFEPQDAGQVLWATQPWMALNALTIALVGLWWLGRRKYPGQVTLIMLLIYSITRFAIELFRGDVERGTWFGGALSTSQLISIVSGATALFLLVRLRGLRVPFQPAAAVS
jgi:phosphatidylglycerol---prolipoprotein diacylglyceryl transferase